MSRVPGNQFLGRLSEADRLSIEPHLQTIPVQVEQCLQRSGEEHEYVILPLSGAVAVGVPLPRGGVTETAIVGCEGMLGGLAAAASVPALYSCHVRLPGEVARISKAAFRNALDRSPPMRELAARCDASLLALVQQSVYCNAVHPVEERLCRWLLQVHDRSSSDKLPLTQDLLAQSLGVRRTTITLVAGKLQAAGVINWRRGHVQIAKREHLEQHACGCYACAKKYLDIMLSATRSESLPLQNGREDGHSIAQLAI
jgi:CRP-like cAMP-binding protein